MKNCIGIINLDENENRMGELVVNRSLASVPIAARYRVIDFVLSNMTNSGINCIGIFTKNKSRSLIDHITNGRPWDLNRKTDGIRVFNFGNDDPLYDDVHNFAENIQFLNRSRKEYVLLAPSYMVCNINYKEVVEYHKSTGKDVTMIYKKVTNADEAFGDCGVLNIDDTGSVISVGENIGKNPKANINIKTKDEGPTFYSDKSNVVNSIIANGCRIEGTVENCVIGRRVYIGKNTKIKDCIIMQNSRIEDDVVLDNVIADKGSEIRKGETLIGSTMYPLVIKKKK